MPLLYPLINGHRYDWSSCTIKVNGVPFDGVKEIMYKDSLEPGEIRGTHSQIIGRTRGQYKAEGSMSIYKEEHAVLVAALAVLGFGEAVMSISASYTENFATVTDTLVGVRIKSNDGTNTESSDALVVKCDLSLMYIMWNGVATMVRPDKLLK